MTNAALPKPVRGAGPLPLGPKPVVLADLHPWIRRRAGFNQLVGSLPSPTDALAGGADCPATPPKDGLWPKLIPVARSLAMARATGGSSILIAISADPPFMPVGIA